MHEESTFHERLQRPCKGFLQTIASSWDMAGIGGARLIKSSTSLQSAIAHLDKTWFDQAGRPLQSRYWSELFGQVIPSGPKDSTNSGRVLISSESIIAMDNSGIVLRICDIVQRDLTRDFQRHGKRISIERTSFAIVSRLCTRIPAQRIHVDGDSEETDRSNVISILIAVRPQRGVVFLKSNPSSVLWTEQFHSPLLAAGDRIEFEQSRVSHIGHSVTDFPAGDMISHAIFVTFTIRQRSEKTLENAKYVDISPDIFCRHLSENPAPAKCICCLHPIVNVERGEVQWCLDCSSGPVPPRRNLKLQPTFSCAICPICSAFPLDPIPVETLEKELANAAPKSLMNFFSKCALSYANPRHQDHLCPHPFERRAPFPPTDIVLLFFDIYELERGLDWFTEVMKYQALTLQHTQRRIHQMTSLSEFVNIIGGPCPRSQFVLALVFELLGIRDVRGSEYSVTCLIAERVDESFLSVTESRLSVLKRYAKNPRDGCISALTSCFHRLYREWPHSQSNLSSTDSSRATPSLRCSCFRNDTQPVTETPLCELIPIKSIFNESARKFFIPKYREMMSRVMDE